MPALSAEICVAIEQLKRQEPLSGFIVVTILTTDTVRILARSPELAKEIVLLDDVSTHLIPRVRSALSDHFLERGAANLLAVLDPPPPVRKFIESVWITPLPCRTVAGAAREAGAALDHLRREWSGVPLQATLKELVDWGLLGRAVAMRGSAPSWYGVAHTLRTTERRLERIAQRHLGVTPALAVDAGVAWVEMRFQAWLREVMAGHRAV